MVCREGSKDDPPRVERSEVAPGGVVLDTTTALQIFKNASAEEQRDMEREVLQCIAMLQNAHGQMIQSMLVFNPTSLLMIFLYR